MKITGIKQQVKRSDRYSIFIDGRYGFSLSDTALLDNKLVPGQELSAKEVREFKQLSQDDKLYNLTLRYVALRPRSRWEIETYLERKKAAPALTSKILNKLSDIDLIDDKKFAVAFASDRRQLRLASRRKIIQELRQKRVADDVIQIAVGNKAEDEHAALHEVIDRKRRQSRYHDDLKLMQYLARQGFNYGDIKDALKDSGPNANG